jgi:hypothetical protein
MARHRYTAIIVISIASLMIWLVPNKFLLAEQYPSGISGRVTMLDGSVLSGAEIRTVQSKTKLFLTAKTDDKGEYTILLEPGTYDVFVKMPSWNMKPVRRKNIGVITNAKSIVDFVLQPPRNQVVDEDHP